MGKKKGTKSKGSSDLELLNTPTYESVELSEVLEKYDVVGPADSGDFLIVAERPMSLRESNSPPRGELGSASTTQWGNYATRDYNPQLRGYPGLRKFDEMRRSDGEVRMALTLRKMPILAARWYIEPYSKSRRDKKIAEHVWKCLTEYMSVSWPQLLRELLLHFDFGWYALEKVWAKDERGAYLQKLAPRHPLDSQGWEYDDNGGPDGVWLNSQNGMGNNAQPYGGPAGVSTGARLGQVFIAINRLLVFTHDKEGGNIEGISMLRPMYKHWFIKDTLYKIDAIQKERHGIGIPLIKLPAIWDAKDKIAAEELGRNLRTNEKAHVTLPFGWDIAMLELKGHPVDAIKSAEHHNHMIASSAMVGFTEITRASAGLDVLIDIYMKTTRNDADTVRDVFNKWLFPDIVRYNFGKNADVPELKVRRIGETTDWRTISFALRNLVGAQLVIPDQPLMDSVRTEFDLPDADPSTAIPVMAPQGPGDGGGGGGGGGESGSPTAPEPGRAGMPRQSAPKPSGAGRPNSGVDSSGGSK